MNKRMKKKASKFKPLTDKQRIVNQKTTIHQLFKENNKLNAKISHLEAVIITKEEVMQQKSNSIQLIANESAKKIYDLEELVELHKKDAIAANKAYEDTEKELQDLRGICAEYKGQVLYWKQAYQDTAKELDQERAKSWWKKVLHG